MKTIESAPITIPADQHAVAVPPEKAVAPKAVETKAKAQKPKADAHARVAAISAAAKVIVPFLTTNKVKATLKPFNNGDSFALKLPPLGQLVAKLPKSADAKQAIGLLKTLREDVSAFTRGDASATWVFHRSGSFALYSKLA